MIISTRYPQNQPHRSSEQKRKDSDCWERIYAQAGRSSHLSRGSFIKTSRFVSFPSMQTQLLILTVADVLIAQCERCSCSSPSPVRPCTFWQSLTSIKSSVSQGKPLWAKLKRHTGISWYQLISWVACAWSVSNSMHLPLQNVVAGSASW